MKKGILCFLLLSLVGCDSQPKLEEGNYVLQGSNKPVITLAFDATDGRYFGQAVNAYFGTYKADEAALTFGSPSSDMRSGRPAEMDAETDYLTTLRQINHYDLTAERLILTGPNGVRLIFDRHPL